MGLSPLPPAVMTQKTRRDKSSSQGVGQVPRLPYRGHQGWGPHTPSLQSDGPSEPRPSDRMGLHPTARRWDSEADLTAEATKARSSGPCPGGSRHGVDPDVWPPALLAALLHLLAGWPLSSLPNPGLQRPAPRSARTWGGPTLSAQGSPRLPLSKSAVATGRAACCPEGPAGPE